MGRGRKPDTEWWPLCKPWGRWEARRPVGKATKSRRGMGRGTVAKGSRRQVQRRTWVRRSFVGVDSQMGGRRAAVVPVVEEDTVGTGGQEGRDKEDCMAVGKSLGVACHALEKTTRSPQMEEPRMWLVGGRRGNHSARSRQLVEVQKEERHLHMHQGSVPRDSAPYLPEACCHHYHHSQPARPSSLYVLPIASSNLQAIRTWVSWLGHLELRLGQGSRWLHGARLRLGSTLR